MTPLHKILDPPLSKVMVSTDYTYSYTVPDFLVAGVGFLVTKKPADRFRSTKKHAAWFLHIKGNLSNHFLIQGYNYYIDGFRVC